jgi:hypothetical protein
MANIQWQSVSKPSLDLVDARNNPQVINRLKAEALLATLTVPSARIPQIPFHTAFPRFRKLPKELRLEIVSNSSEDFSFLTRTTRRPLISLFKAPRVPRLLILLDKASLTLKTCSGDLQLLMSLAALSP